MATTAAFDKASFGPGFFTVDVIPTVVGVYVPREHRKVSAGQAVSLFITVADLSTTPGRSFPFSSLNGAEIQLYQFLGGIVQAWAVMDQLDVGIYGYNYQTAYDADIGVYSGRFRVTNGDAVAITEPQVLFEIIL